MNVRPNQVALAPRLILAFLLAVGFFAIWFFGWMLLDDFLRPITGGSGYKQLVFTEDGTPLISVHPAGGQQLLEPIYHTLEGELVPNPREVTLLDDYPQELSAKRREVERISAEVNWGMGLLGFSALSPAMTYWYLIHDYQPEGSAYFVGYDALTHQKIGYFGRRGFTTTIPPGADRIQIPFSLLLSGGWHGAPGSRGRIPSYEPQRRYSILMISGDELLKINLSAQTVAPVSLPGKVITLGSFVQHLPVMGGSKSEEVDRVIVRLPEELQFLDDQGEFHGRLPLPPELREKTLTLRSVKPDEFIIESATAERYAPHELTWMGADGTVLRTASVEIFQRPQERASESWMLTLIVPVPALIAAFSPLDAYSKVQNGEQPNVRTALLELVRRFWAPYTVLVLLSVGLAVWTYRRHRRYETRGTLAWAVFVLLLGPLGLVAYLVHWQWPVRTACEHCGKATPRNRGECLACEQPFPAPELRGIEVFA